MNYYYVKVKYETPVYGNRKTFYLSYDGGLCDCKNYSFSLDMATKVANAFTKMQNEKAKRFPHVNDNCEVTIHRFR